MENQKEGCSVLFVDDEKNLLSSIRRTLIHEPYRQYFIDSGEGALKFLEEHQVSVIATDLLMPGMDGLTLLNQVKLKYPHIVRVIITGATDIVLVLNAIHSGETHRVITKPIRFDEELIPVIRQSIQLYELLQKNESMNKMIRDYNTKLLEMNREYQMLKDIAEKDNDRKSKIINQLEGVLTPFIHKVINSMQQLSVDDRDNFLLIKNQLMKEGQNHVKFLKEMRKLLILIELDGLKKI
jgi:two-component system response regulator HupR/HoxA